METKKAFNIQNMRILANVWRFFNYIIFEYCSLQFLDKIG